MKRLPLKTLLGVLLVFVLPLTTTVATVARDIIKPSENAVSRKLHVDATLYSPDILFETNVFAEPVVSVVFDDGWKSIYQNAFPTLEELGINSTQFIIVGAFDDPKYMSTQQVLHMYRYGHEIQSHTVTHRDLTQLTSEELETELYDSRIALEQLLGVPVEDIAVPLGSYNTDTKNAAGRWYRSLRTTQSGINTLENFDTYELFSPTIVNTDTPDTITNYIDEAKQTNGWLIITYHQIDDSGDKYAVSPEMFRRHMQILVESGVDIVPLSTVLDTIKEQSR